MRVCSQCGLVLADDNPIEHCGGAPHDVEPLGIPARIAERFRVVGGQLVEIESVVVPLASSP
jgi:hypothetical protein